MKKNLLLCIGVVLLAACSQTPQQQAEKAVSKHLKSSVEAYVAGEFGVLDTVRLLEVPAYKQANDSLHYYKKEMQVMADQFRVSAMQRGTKRMKMELQNLENYYSNKKFSIEHTYSSADGEKTETFFLNAYYKVKE